MTKDLIPGRGFFMFTGIINNLGRVTDLSKNRIIVKTDKDFVKKLATGVSVSLNGICLTVVNLAQDSFKVDMMPETKQRTNLGEAKVGDLINLELPATPNTFLSGHIVQGHVDGVVGLENIKKVGNSYILKFFIPSTISKFLVEKGAITLSGISLTVIEAGKDFFTVGIIPFTYSHTNFSQIKVGDKVNIEVDILAKYLERLIRE